MTTPLPFYRQFVKQTQTCLGSKEGLVEGGRLRDQVRIFQADEWGMHQTEAAASSEACAGHSS